MFERRFALRKFGCKGTNKPAENQRKICFSSFFRAKVPTAHIPCGLALPVLFQRPFLLGRHQ